MYASERAAGTIATDPKIRVRATMALTRYLDALLIHILLFCVDNLKTLIYASQRLRTRFDSRYIQFKSRGQTNIVANSTSIPLHVNNLAVVLCT
jgi:hypothetical protein